MRIETAQLFLFNTLFLGSIFMDTFSDFCKKSTFLILFFFGQTGFSQTLNYYFGNIHAHSAYSDGNQDSATTNHTTPAQDFNYANNSYHFDFEGISDHNHFGAGMTKAKYHLGVSQAVSATTSDFVALYGMEYGVISSGGHVLVYGIDSLIGWQTNNYDIYNAEANYSTLWSLIHARPAAFGSLAHPQVTDFTDLLTAAYSTLADQAVSGLSVRSGYSLSTTTNYTDNPATLYETYFQTMLAKGYHIAPSIDHDNHNTTFGRTLPGRTVILAPSLTKIEVLSALKNMHYYGSDDWNAQVNFTIGSQILGNVANMNSDPNITVSVSDADNETVSKIELFYGIPGSGSLPTVLTSVNNSATLSFTHTLAVGQTRYYYAKIKQTDGDFIWTAPIWITRIAGTLPIELTDFQANSDKKNVQLFWNATITEPTIFQVERSENGVDFSEIGKIEASILRVPTPYFFKDSTAERGLHFYRLRQIEHSGTETFSPIKSVFLEKSPFQISSIQPNPTDGLVKCLFQSTAEMQVTCSIFDSEGRLLSKEEREIFSGENAIETDLTDFPAGIYWLLLATNGTRMLEVKLVKTGK
jgi:hypothetical protein